MSQYKYKLKETPTVEENIEFKVGDTKISKGVKYTVTSLDKETGAVKWDVDYLPNLSELFDTATELVRVSKGVYLKAKDDPKFRDFYEEAKIIKNSIRTHIRNEYPDDYRRITTNIDEMSTTGGGAGAASFTSGTGAQYATPYAFRKKGQKTDDKAYKEIGYKSINEEGESWGLEPRQLADSFTFDELEQLYNDKKISKEDLNGAKSYLQAWIDQHPTYLPQRDLTKSFRQKIRDKYLNEESNIDMDRVFMKGKDKDKFYVTVNRGHGDGKFLVKSSESEHTEPRIFSRDEAVAYVERAQKNGATPGRQYAYWVSDINMDRIDEIFGKKEEPFTKDYGNKISKDDFKNKIPVGRTVLYSGSRYEVMKNDGYVLKLKSLGDGDYLTINLSQFIDQGALNENKEKLSYINKSRAKSSLKQIENGKRDDGMGKFTAKVFAIKNDKEIELKNLSDLSKYSTGYKYALKENVGATLGPGPKASPDGVKDSAYVNQFKYKLVPKKIKGAGTIVKQIFEEESKKTFQQKRIEAFDGVEKKLNNIYTMISNAKNETADYYKNNPDSYSVVKPTDLIVDYLEDIEKLLKGE